MEVAAPLLNHHAASCKLFPKKMHEFVRRLWSVKEKMLPEGFGTRISASNGM